MKRTKIVCTIGPASQSPRILERMARAGMNVARLNFSHGSHPEHRARLRDIRAIGKKLDQPIAVLQDLQGPKIRVGVLPKEGVQLRAGQSVIFTTGGKDGKKIPVQYRQLHRDVRRGERILMDDGLLECEVAGIRGNDVVCRVVVGGTLHTNKGINLPDTSVSISPITLKDKADLEFGVQQGVDFVALSFVRRAREVHTLRELIEQFGKKYRKQHLPKIIVKIEKPEALANFDDILSATDAIMVARGDLGVEIAAQRVPLAQKMIIEKCLKAAKPVIVATQMLDSMIRNPRPTRAEVSDVANAVIDHADAVMLSGETANGLYPVEAVQTMSNIILAAEGSHFDDFRFRGKVEKESPIDEAISSIATTLARKIYAKVILVASLTGNTARIVSRYRPELPILVSTNSECVRRQLNLSWGVIPFVLKRCKDIDELVDRSINHLRKKKFLKRGDPMIIIAGQPVGRAGNVNWVKIHEVE